MKESSAGPLVNSAWAETTAAKGRNTHGQAFTPKGSQGQEPLLYLLCPSPARPRSRLVFPQHEVASSKLESLVQNGPGTVPACSRPCWLEYQAQLPPYSQAAVLLHIHRGSPGGSSTVFPLPAHLHSCMLTLLPIHTLSALSPEALQGQWYKLPGCPERRKEILGAGTAQI